MKISQAMIKKLIFSEGSKDGVFGWIKPNSWIDMETFPVGIQFPLNIQNRLSNG